MAEKTVRRSYFDNRELSWLKFNERVLDEAGNARVPLGERLGFLSIYQTNLDEFFMIRVGSLMDQMRATPGVRDNKTNMTGAEQVVAILKRTVELERRKGRIWRRLQKELEPHGLCHADLARLSGSEEEELAEYFDGEIAPFLSPMIIGRQQPFPFLNDRAVYLVTLMATRAGKSKLGVVLCRNEVFNRFIELPARPGVFLLSEELILHFAERLFGRHRLREKVLCRVTRNADLDEENLYDEDLDCRDAMAHLIRQRRRLSPVRLEVSRPLSARLAAELSAGAQLPRENVVAVKTPLDLDFVFLWQDRLRVQENLFYPRRSPRPSAFLNRKTPLWRQIGQKDVLLSFPYESIRPFLDLLHEASTDPSVVSIKMTLYRLARRSQIAEALIEAAENGKEVIVVMELRARFDETNNIEWSRRLEEAGCHLIYGLGNYKVHSKLCLITRKTGKGISYLTQVGTGNYNEKTAALYADFSLLTASPEIGRETARVFQSLMMGEMVEGLEHLLVAPRCLQNRVLEFMDREIAAAREGQEAYIGLKMNSLTDKVIIEKLIEAIRAGVRIELIVRGICCLVAAGGEENITVISIVGRFLEHSRIYRFGVGEREMIYLSSADFMTRNTTRRVEAAVPVYDESIRMRIRHAFDTMMRDDENGKCQNAQGIYEARHLGSPKLNSQECFLREAYDRAGRMEEN